MDDRPLLLGVRLGGEDHVGVLGQSVGERRGVRDHRRRRLQRGLPAGAVALGRERVGVQQVQDAGVAVGERAHEVGRAGLRVGVAGTVRGGEAGLADAAAVRRRRDLEQPGAGVVAEPEPGGEVEQRLRGAVAARPGQQPLAVDDHDVLAGAAEPVGERAHRGRVRAGRGRRAAERAVVAAERRVECDEQRLAAAGRRAQDGLGVRVERGRPRGRDAELDVMAAHALADPQVEDRGVVDGVAVEHEHRVRVLEVGHGGLQRGVGERARQPRRHGAPRRACELRRPEALAEQPLDEEGLLVRRVPARERGRAAAGLLERVRGVVERLLPARRHEHRALADERLGDPLVDVRRLVGEAALVAQPAVVDLVVLAREHAHDAVVADGQLDVALRRAVGADGARALDVPRARAEAVGGRRQRADGAQLDDVAAERRDVGMAVERRDVRVGAALGEDQLVVLRDLLREADAAVAEDAPLAVDRDQRRQLERLAEVPLRLDEAGGPRPPAVGDVLQRALAALVADGAVERMVDEQELDHRALGRVDALGLRVDDHAVLDRRRAAGLQLRDALDLDEAHPARADRLAELRLVAEDRDLDVAVLGGVDEHRVLRRRDLAAVDRQRDEVDVGTRHRAT